jgi:hypothetical protein
MVGMTGSLVLVILIIATTAGILILTGNRMSAELTRDHSRWYVRHILIFPVQRATCPAQPVQCRAILGKKKKKGKKKISMTSS